MRWLRRRPGGAREPRVGEPIDSIAKHLRRLVLRLAGAGIVAAILLVLAQDPRVAAGLAFSLANIVVVGAASWRFGPLERWAVVVLATVFWTGGGVGLGELGWPPAPPWPGAALRFGALASIAVGVSGFRQAIERLLKTEDTLAATLVRERDSARRDRLTRLWNTRYFYEILEQEIARCRRYGRPFGLLLVDLDGFKAVNDTAGHLAGDLVLQIVGRILHENCRSTDIPARLGGDEFAVILPEASSLTVRRSAQKLVALVADADFPSSLPRVTASVGGVAFSRPPASIKEALRAVDETLYAAKREGKNRFVVPLAERVG
jgi:diguanylate cyclase (GGDEF)-like protein